MISVSNLNPGALPRVFHRLTQVVWWPGEGVLCCISRWLSCHRSNPTSVQSSFWHPVKLTRVSRLHYQLVQSCLPYPMSDFSWSWNQYFSVWAPSLRRSCVCVVIPSQRNKLKTQMYQASPSTTPWQPSLGSMCCSRGRHISEASYYLGKRG